MKGVDNSRRIAAGGITAEAGRDVKEGAKNPGKAVRPRKGAKDAKGNTLSNITRAVNYWFLIRSAS
jgi:hypothetical protein